MTDTKYEAFLHHEDDDGNGDCRYDFPYFVGDPENRGTYLGPKFTGSEAHIIAFALTTIANGDHLYSQGLCTECNDPECEESTAWTQYSGPTEGVRD